MQQHSFDGAGHSINASAGFENAGLRILGINNVNVKNLKISGDYSTNIYLGGSSNCTIKNVKTEGELHLNSGDFNISSKLILENLAYCLHKII